MLNSAAQYLLLGTALCLAPLNTLRAQFCWECYQPRTLRQLVDSAPEPPDSGFVFRGDDHPSRVLVTYTGKSGQSACGAQPSFATTMRRRRASLCPRSLRTSFCFARTQSFQETSKEIPHWKL